MTVYCYDLERVVTHTYLKCSFVARLLEIDSLAYFEIVGNGDNWTSGTFGKSSFSRVLYIIISKY